MAGDPPSRIEDERWAAHFRVHDVIERDINRRLDEMNMLRRQIESERGLYMTREASEAGREALRAKVDLGLDTLRNKIDAVNRLMWIGLGGVSAGMSLLGLVIKLWPTSH